MSRRLDRPVLADDMDNLSLLDSHGVLQSEVLLTSIVSLLLDRETTSECETDDKIQQLPEFLRSLHLLWIGRAEENLVLRLVLQDAVHYLYGGVQ